MIQINEENSQQESRSTALYQWFEAFLSEMLPQLLPELLQELEQSGFKMGQPPGALQVVSGDASFRRYFRSAVGQHTFILVDAPPEKEDSQLFVNIAELLKIQGVCVPEVYGVDFERGFMCLSDLGDTLLWEQLDKLQAADASTNNPYQNAFAELIKIQRCHCGELPSFDEAHLKTEMGLFSQWFCGSLLELSLSAEEEEMLSGVYEFLSQAALSQPQVFVHRDYHSRNLMITEQSSIGVIDFQDAVYGPVTYDLVSLLKDCYIRWPRASVKLWALQFGEMLVQANIIAELDEKKFIRDFELMGMQRHLKVAGIFSRLSLRDGKKNYLKDIPLTLQYLQEVAQDYEELQVFSQWLEQRVIPVLPTALQIQQSSPEPSS